MAKQTPAQKQIVERVMHAFKQGDLDSSTGAPVTDPKQAISIALHEAGASNEESPAENKKRLARTRRRESGRPVDRSNGTTRAALYAEAQRRDIPGRSGMTRAQLERALAS